jgi:membrane associated rhomboid family serine protease
MGIYDREYYRREGPSFLESLTNRGKVCKWLILANVVCFVIQLLTMRPMEPTFPGLEGMPMPRGPGWFTDWFILDVNKVMQGQVWRLLTCAFLHDEGNLAHILFNMLFLWWFGHDVEDLYGPREFLAFYLTAAVFASGAFVAAHLAGLSGSRALGASGAVTAVMVLFATHYPSRIILLFFFLPVPVWLLVIFFVAQDLFGLLGGGGRGGVAVSAHLGGAAFGFVYHQCHWRITSILPDLRSWWRGFKRPRARPRLRVYREEEPVTPVHAAPSPPPQSAADEHLEAQVDEVLAKVARSGKESLTQTEQEILLRASEIYKKRRS